MDWTGGNAELIDLALAARPRTSDQTVWRSFQHGVVVWGHAGQPVALSRTRQSWGPSSMARSRPKRSPKTCRHHLACRSTRPERRSPPSSSGPSRSTGPPGSTPSATGSRRKRSHRPDPTSTERGCGDRRRALVLHGGHPIHRRDDRRGRRPHQPRRAVAARLLRWPGHAPRPPGRADHPGDAGPSGGRAHRGPRSRRWLETLPQRSERHAPVHVFVAASTTDVGRRRPTRYRLFNGLGHLVAAPIGLEAAQQALASMVVDRMANADTCPDGWLIGARSIADGDRAALATAASIEGGSHLLNHLRRLGAAMDPMPTVILDPDGRRLRVPHSPQAVALLEAGVLRDPWVDDLWVGRKIGHVFLPVGATTRPPAERAIEVLRDTQAAMASSSATASSTPSATPGGRAGLGGGHPRAVPAHDRPPAAVASRLSEPSPSVLRA